MPTLTERQQILNELLQAHRTLSIAEIRQHFSISSATAYRDARALLQLGLALKTSNGIRLAPPAEPSSTGGEKCAFCGGMVNARSVFVIQLQDGSQQKACCSHCGLLALDQMATSAALATDFLYGRRINARQAFYLLESSVTLCCQPSVLCFSNPQEAANFQKGFGGKLYGLEDIRIRLAEMMAMEESQARNVSGDAV
jgi:hypothetical protein